MVKTFGKTMSEFKSATNEFKSTWEKEASFELEEESKKKINSSTETSLNTETMISLEPTTQEFEQKSFPAPKIKQLPPEVIAQTFQNRELLGETKTESAENKIEKQTSDKRDWI
jgi:Sec-independent protein translocase protein TatA